MNKGHYLPLGAASFGFLFASSVAAQEYCSSMEVYLSIGSNHRETVMDHIAPLIAEEFGTELIVEEMGSGPMMERVTAQGANPRTSIVFLDFAVSAEACETMCAAIELDRIPSFSAYPDWGVLRSSAGDAVGLAYMVVGIGLVYDEEEFENRGLPLPTSWSDLGREDLAGRTSITSPVSTYGTALVAALSEAEGAPAGDFDPGFAVVQDLLPNLHSVHTFSGELGNLMQLKEVWLATTGSNVASTLNQQNTPVRWVAPEEGAPAMVGGMSLIEGAPCEAESYAFLDHYLSDEFQAIRIANGSASPSNSAWDLVSPEVVAEMPLLPSDFDNLVDIDWTIVAPLRPAMIERWQQEVR